MKLEETVQDAKKDEAEEEHDSEPVYHLWDIFRYRKIFMYTVILWFVWYGMFFNEMFIYCKFPCLSSAGS